MNVCMLRNFQSLTKIDLNKLPVSQALLNFASISDIQWQYKNDTLFVYGRADLSSVTLAFIGRLGEAYSKLFDESVIYGREFLKYKIETTSETESDYLALTNINGIKSFCLHKDTPIANLMHIIGHFDLAQKIKLMEEVYGTTYGAYELNALGIAQYIKKFEGEIKSIPYETYRHLNRVPLMFNCVSTYSIYQFIVSERAKVLESSSGVAEFNVGKMQDRFEFLPLFKFVEANQNSGRASYPDLLDYVIVKDCSVFICRYKATRSGKSSHTIKYLVNGKPPISIVTLSSLILPYIAKGMESYSTILCTNKTNEILFENMRYRIERGDEFKIVSSIDFAKVQFTCVNESIVMHVQGERNRKFFEIFDHKEFVGFVKTHYINCTELNELLHMFIHNQKLPMVHEYFSYIQYLSNDIVRKLELCQGESLNNQLDLIKRL